MLLALWGPLRAAPLDALDPAAQPFFLRAESEAAAGRTDAAVSFYQLVLGHDPHFVPAVLGLGQTLESAGRLEEAEALYRSGSSSPDVLAALATLLERSNPREALGLWRQLQSSRLGDPVPYLHEARLLVSVDPEAAGSAWEAYVTFLQGEEPDGELLLRLLTEDPENAEPRIRQYLLSWPEGGIAAELKLRLDRIEVEAAAATIDLGMDTPLTAAQVLEAEHIAELLAVGNVSAARDAGRALVAAAPASSASHGAFADALIAAGAWTEAEVQARIARRLAPDNATARARLARLYTEAYGGRRRDEALDEMLAACRLRPGDVTLRLGLAALQQEAGRVDEAVASLRVVLAADRDSVWGREAEARLEALTRVPPAVPEATSTAMPLSAEGARHWRVGLELLRRGRRAEALAELDLAVAAEPANHRLLNTRAGLDREAGDVEAATRRWKASLAIEPNQPEVWRNLAETTTDRDERRRALQAAASAGDADAHYLLAALAHGLGDWTTTRAELLAYESSAARSSPYRQAASALQAEEAARRQRFWLLGGAVLSVGLSAAAAWAWRRRTGRSLRELLEATPETWHEAARLLAGIRHEVLKHNTTVLPEVATALEAGDSRPWDALAPRLPELSSKLHAYVDALQTLGAARHVRFDAARDPTMGPLLRAFARLERIRRPDPAELRELSAVINEAAYHELGRTVREICVLQVDEALVVGVYARVSAEPGFAGTLLPELWVTGGPLTLRLFRPDLEDILANLLRNALSAGARTLAVSLSEGEDDITGHPLAELAVIDDAPGTLTNAMIRSRFIGRGLGLAVDLVNRHGGSIRVDAQADGAKAVVVQFQLAEAGMSGEFTEEVPRPAAQAGRG